MAVLPRSARVVRHVHDLCDLSYGVACNVCCSIDSCVHVFQGAFRFAYSNTVYHRVFLLWLLHMCAGKDTEAAIRLLSKTLEWNSQTSPNMPPVLKSPLEDLRQSQSFLQRVWDVRSP